MANRRMFAKSIVNSSKFLMLPTEVRELYFQLGMAADDDGYVEYFSVIKTISAQESMVYHLATKGYLTVYNDYVLHITDWEVNNQIRKDRHTDSVYKKKKLQPLVYEWQPDGNQMATNDCHSVVKVSIEKEKNIKKEKEEIPFNEILDYLNQQANKNYRAVNSHKGVISARWKEGYRLEDFKSVIDKKVVDWSGSDMCRYLRPATLFGTKFDSYLNEGTVVLTREQIIQRIADEQERSQVSDIPAQEVSR